MDTVRRPESAKRRPTILPKLLAALFVLVLVVVFGLVQVTPSIAEKSENDQCIVVLLCPTTQEDHPFWELFLGAMQAAAESLQMDLRIQRFDDSRFNLLEAAKRTLLSPEKPDYLVFPYYLQVGEAVLHLAEGAGVYSYMVNAAIPCEEQKALGKPGERFRYWLGGMFPDDFQAGFALADHLVKVAKKRNLVAADGYVHVIGISGSRDTAVACTRNNGMKKALLENGAVLDRLVHAYWKPSVAFDKISRLVASKTEATVIWAASDRMALAARKALRAHHMENSFVIGGIDWSPEGLQSIAQGGMTISMGGHFMDGARALVCLYDHWNGRREEARGVRVSTMSSASKDNVNAIRRFVREESWSGCNFKALTLKESERESYLLSLTDMFECCRKVPLQVLSFSKTARPHH